tara:strand:- start:335 stop:805 length:471 start_codon:yes stop_codon:yes gene_type:complete
MTFRKIISLFLFLFFICIGSINVNADDNDQTKEKQEATTSTTTTTNDGEEPLPLNDPFAGDESLSGGTAVVTGSAEEREAMSLYRFKLVGIIGGLHEKYVSLVNAAGEVMTLGLHEELSAGIKFVDLRNREAIFEKDDNTYLIINFKNQIKEVNEY